MTKKYEKFEEWMLHAPVVTSNGDSGKIVQSVGEGRVAVLLDRGVEILSRVWNLEFIEAGSTGSSPIPWEVCQVVWDVVYGKGVVNCVAEDDIFPVKVEFDDGGSESYTLQGSFYKVGTRTLFFSEPTISADTMPPKKPSVPKLRFDDGLMVINSHGKVECYGYVEQEFEDSVAMRTGEMYVKSYYNFFKLGEEIKWEN